MPRRMAHLTADGTNTGAFTSTEWSMLALVACIWGSSFLWIAIGLESMSPSSIAFCRVLLGALALALYPPARRRVNRADWPIIAAVGIVGNALPALFFATGQQYVASSVAGMVNAATPLAVLGVSILMLGRSPGPRQVRGLIIGFVGVGLMTSPSLLNAEESQPLGLLFLLLAVLGYGVSNNIVVPVQQRYGSAAVIMRAQFLGAVVLAPWGLPSSLSDEPTGRSLIAVVVLGVMGTGVARALSAALAGRAGASRSSLITYFVPIVAIVLGVLVRDETVAALELAGTALILLGAFWASRAQRTRTGATDISDPAQRVTSP